ncbi:MAG TPA: hypothetical protein VF864_03815 [Gemmatimonadales bacterium]
MVALDRAVAEADKAVKRAEAAGDGTLQALALRARAEIRALRGELDLAHHDLDALGALRGFVPNSIHDAEDLRVVAVLRAAEGDLAAAERALREVIQRAEVHHLSQLHAEATRDLSALFARAEVPIDPPSGSKRPCGTESYIALTHATLATSAA